MVRKPAKKEVRTAENCTDTDLPDEEQDTAELPQKRRGCVVRQPPIPIKGIGGASDDQKSECEEGEEQNFST